MWMCLSLVSVFFLVFACNGGHIFLCWFPFVLTLSSNVRIYCRWLYKQTNKLQLQAYNQPLILLTDPHQFLVEAGRCPVVCGGIEGRIFAWHHWIGHNHTVSLVHAKTSASFNLGCQMGAGWIREQPPHSLVVFDITAKSVVDHAAATVCAGFPAQ